MKKTIIYNDSVIDCIDNNKEYLINLLKDNDEEANEENITQAAIYEINNQYDIMQSCFDEYDNKNNYDYILCVADLGLWYGRRQGYKHFKSLKEAVNYIFEDMNQIYFDGKNKTIKAQAIHHDGINNFKFYKVINGKQYAIKQNDILSCY